MKFILYVLCLLVIPCIAQTKDETPAHAQIELKKTSPILRGWIIALKRDTIDLKLEQSNELVRIAINDIHLITYLDSVVDLKENDTGIKQEQTTEVPETKVASGRKKRRNWNETFPAINYLFVPSALPVERGNLFYNNKYILLHSLHWGVSKKFSVYAGGRLRLNQFFSGGMRYNIIHRNGFALSAGVNYLRFGGDAIETTTGENINNVGLVYLATTRGSTNSNFTLGVGYFFLGNGTALPPSILVGGTTRLSNHIALTGESWILFAGYRIPSGNGTSGSTTTFPFIFSYAMRLVYEDSHLDIGFINNQDFSLLTKIGIPYIGYTRRLFK